jgi:hypothetical protein
MTQISQQLIESVFASSLKQFLEREVQEILEGTNERNNCSRWAMYLEKAAHEQGLTQYVADAEYNRKQDGKIKTILDGQHHVVTINCDLILHTRGANISEDNLIAIEMKKSDRPDEEKQSDRQRLRALTKASYDGAWMNDGTNPPEHVCGYRLGAFVELDRRQRSCTVEFFKGGNVCSTETHSF